MSTDDTSLRIILMSATVDAAKLSNFFDGCPVLHVPGRTFPVDALYLEDAIQYTGWSIREDSPYAKRREYLAVAGCETSCFLSQGRDKFHQSKGRTDWEEPTFIDEDEDDPLVEGEAPVGVPIILEKRYSSQTKKTVELLNERVIPYELILRLLEHLCFEDKSLHSSSSAVLIFMPGLAEIRRLGDLLSEHPSFGDESWFRVYPLHSMLSSDDQNAVFDTPPARMRKIVIGICSARFLVHAINLELSSISDKHCGDGYHDP
jgi:ATP-dependent RNA helicase DHX29